MLNEIVVTTRSRVECIKVDADVTSAVRRSGVREGICHLWVPHTTAAVTINENADPDVVRDILFAVSKLVPYRDQYHHGEGNSDAHIKSSLFGPALSILVNGGSLVLGTWQSIYFCEFDGPRQRRLLVKVMDRTDTGNCRTAARQGPDRHR